MWHICRNETEESERKITGKDIIGKGRSWSCNSRPYSIKYKHIVMIRVQSAEGLPRDELLCFHLLIR